MRKYFETFLTDRQILQNEPLCRHTTFKIGGAADLVVVPSNTAQIKKALGVCRENSIPFFIMGSGSNILVGDKGFRGVAIKLASDFSDIEIHECSINAQSGASLIKIANEAMKHSLTGFEFASGIPGTLGGGICMNAGAYSGEMKDVVVSIKVIEDGEEKLLSNNDADFGYRRSVFLNKDIYIIGAQICLRKGNIEEIKSKTEELRKLRIEKQPLEFPSAGSTFKRPLNAFASKLIDEAGLRGYRVGDAQVSLKHCGFIINRGRATASDVRKLIDIIKETVYKKFNTELLEEIRMIGEF